MKTLTVKQLVKELSKLNPKLKVWVKLASSSGSEAPVISVESTDTYVVLIRESA